MAQIFVPFLDSFSLLCPALYHIVDISTRTVLFPSALDIMNDDSFTIDRYYINANYCAYVAVPYYTPAPIAHQLSLKACKKRVETTERKAVH